jgi:hypothetical protein
MLKKLKDDHDRLRAIIDALDEQLKTEEPSESSDFARLRWTLIRELCVHAALERRALPTLYASLAKPAFDSGLDHELDKALTSHMIEWGAIAIRDGWRDYRTAAAALLNRLRKRMTYEEATFFAALA